MHTIDKRWGCVFLHCACQHTCTEGSRDRDRASDRDRETKAKMLVDSVKICVHMIPYTYVYVKTYVGDDISIPLHTE